jgi:hypothetical protein
MRVPTRLEYKIQVHVREAMQLPATMGAATERIGLPVVV